MGELTKIILRQSGSEDFGQLVEDGQQITELKFDSAVDLEECCVLLAKNLSTLTTLEPIHLYFLTCGTHSSLI